MLTKYLLLSESQVGLFQRYVEYQNIKSSKRNFKKLNESTETFTPSESQWGLLIELAIVNTDLIGG